MIRSHDNPSYRAISIVALIQAGVVVFGTLFVAVTLKYKGYGEGIVPDSFFNSAALFVRHSGAVLLLVPILWTAFAVIVARSTTRSWAPMLVLLLGIATVFFGIFYYVVLVMNPYII